MTRYTMPARSQGKLYAQRLQAAVRKWLLQRLSSFYCDLQLNNTPPLSSMAAGDEAVEVNALGTVKAVIKATGLNPHLSVCGWPFCLYDLHDTGKER